MPTVATHRIPLPEPSPLTAPFWAAVRDHDFVMQRCSECSHWEWTPKLVCSGCLLDTLAWSQMSGRGRVYTHSTVRRPQSAAFEAPYVMAVVELQEGPRVIARVVDIAPEDVTIGMRVDVGFEDFEKISLYHFRPAIDGDAPNALPGP